MAGASIQMGVDVTQFKQGMKEAQASVKTLDAELKRSEAQLKQTGDKEQYAADKSTILQQKLNAQKTAAANCEKALKAMADNGVRESSEEYQKLARQLAEAQAGIAETTTALNQLTAGEEAAASGANQLTQSVNSIGKKISLDQVISGIGSITNALEGAARKAVEVGKLIWENITDAARYADDTATSASILGMDVEEYQAYRNVFSTEAELTVQEWMKARNKVKQMLVKPTNEQFDIFAALGVGLRDVNGNISPYYNKYVIGAARDWEDVFWDIGAKLRENVQNGKLTQDQADVYAQALFGKSWANLNPIFEMGKEGFKEAVDAQVVASREAIEKNAKLNDTLIDLQNDFNTLKQEVMSGLTPALTGAAEVLDGLLEKLVAYLQSDEGKKALEDMGKAVEGLFEDLGSIDPEKVVEGFAGVFNKIVGGLEWLKDNSGAVISAMETIVKGWGLLKITGGALQILQLINGIRGLGGASAAPWLAGIYALVNPAETGNNDLVDKNGNITPEGQAEFENMIRETKETGEKNRATELIEEAAKDFGDAARMYNDPRIAAALTEFANDRDVEKRDAALEALGYTRKPAFTEAAAKVDEGPGGQVENNRDIAIFKDRRTGEIIGMSSTAVDAFMEQNRGFFTFGEKEVRAPYSMPEEMFQGIMEYADRQARGLWNYTHDANGEFTLGGEKLLDSSNYDFFYNLANGEVQIGDALKSLKDLNVNELKAVFEEIGGVKGRELMEQLPENVGSIAKGVETVGAELTGALSAAAEAIRNIQFPSILGLFGGFASHANGIWSVPFDGYGAILHEGERVVPAREVAASRNFSSNLYVENMNMNNGQDAAGLAAAMAAAQRRTMSGYGS